MAISRDQIAKGNQIGAGTLSEIIKQYKQKEYSGVTILILTLSEN
jgi:hypothetical protein